ncbi:MAG: carboxypeptidase-like regulatory domain-containing protein [Parabacteroides distasonis]|nr:carboxypeptidase-like regulatory domain-containing protein [Parabacteroides distasonis]MBQ4162781.1 carboxypeptidase-like regulatory domain-containing protein [Parabacteroides sp.]
MKQKLTWILSCFLFIHCFTLEGLANNKVTKHLIITGIVKDKNTQKELGNVNITITGGNIGTVSNTDGEFSLKIPHEETGKGLTVSHIGYFNTYLTPEEIKRQGNQLTIWMAPSSFILSEAIIYGGKPRDLVERAIRKIASNYSKTENLFSAFYRETLQKRNRYIGISEAVMNVFKTNYETRTLNRDRVQLLKGRKLISQRPSDTLAIKVEGGPSLSIYLDIVKNGEAILDSESLGFYDFNLDLPVSIDNRMQYVITFKPWVKLDYALYFGKLYIDQERLSITRAEFEMDMSDRNKATLTILQKKPAGVYFKPVELSYLITYKQQGDKTYLNYIGNTIRFKCDWKKRLFSSTYTAYSEMVMIDRKEPPFEMIKYKDAFKQREVFYDKVDEYWDEDFWQDYNIIEPTESLEAAVNKLRKRNEKIINN